MTAEAPTRPAREKLWTVAELLQWTCDRFTREEEAYDRAMIDFEARAYMPNSGWPIRVMDNPEAGPTSG